eukprot:2660691-Pyramimonas_sp.AAC.1
MRRFLDLLRKGCPVDKRKYLGQFEGSPSKKTRIFPKDSRRNILQRSQTFIAYNNTALARDANRRYLQSISNHLYLGL